jgi:hypothetical protein
MIKQYRTCLSTWIIFGTLSLLSWSIVWVNWGHAGILKNAAIPLIVSGAVIIWLTSYRITITPTELRYRNLFGSRSIRRDQIKMVRLQRVSNTRGPPSPQLVVEPRPDSGAKDMIINAKVFSKAAVIAVLDLGKRVAESDDGGLLDGIVMKTLRERKGNDRQ